MLKKTCVNLLSSIVLFTCTSCATLFQGTSEEIQLASDPSGATANINDGRNGSTPYSIRENREQDVQVHFSKPGYQSQDVSDVSHVQWGYVVSDIFFTGLIGLAVDGLDGAMFAHSQQMVSAHLDPLPTVAVAAKQSAENPIAPASSVVSSPAGHDANEHF
jgi:PEGA domain-containing protein